MATFTQAISATSSSARALSKRAAHTPVVTSSHSVLVQKGARTTRARASSSTLFLSGGGISYRAAFLVFYYEDQEEQGPPMPGVGDEDFVMPFALEDVRPTFSDELYRPTIRRD